MTFLNEINTKVYIFVIIIHKNPAPSPLVGQLFCAYIPCGVVAAIVVLPPLFLLHDPFFSR